MTDVYGYMYIHKYDYQCLSSKEIDVKNLLVLTPITHYEYPCIIEYLNLHNKNK